MTARLFRAHRRSAASRSPSAISTRRSHVLTAARVADDSFAEPIVVRVCAPDLVEPERLGHRERARASPRRARARRRASRSRRPREDASTPRGRLLVSPTSSSARVEVDDARSPSPAHHSTRAEQRLRLPRRRSCRPRREARRAPSSSAPGRSSPRVKSAARRGKDAGWRHRRSAQSSSASS